MSELNDRELDVLIAEKVMGWTRLQSVTRPKVVIFVSPESRQTHYFQSRIANGQLVDTTEGDEDNAPRFSSDIKAAMEVVEKMRDSDHWCCIDIHSDYHYLWRVEFKESEARNPHHEVSASAQGESLPRAICEAALSAIEGKE